MLESVTITDRGTLTLPSSVRKSLGITGGQQMLLDVTESGEIILRPATLVPVELYTDARIAEFRQDDEEIGAILDAHFPRG